MEHIGRRMEQIFHDAVLRNVEICEETVVLTVFCHEYLGSDFPITGLFRITYEDVSDLNTDGIPEVIPPITSCHLERCTEEHDSHGRRRNHLIFTGRVWEESPEDSAMNQTKRWKLNFFFTSAIIQLKDGNARALHPDIGTL